MIVLDPVKLDAKGRCPCGPRKPLVYKRPSLHYFCTRCDREYNKAGVQRENFAWRPVKDGFTPTYPQSSAVLEAHGYRQTY